MSNTNVGIGELIADPNNARRHNPRNVGMIVDALHEVGAARSIVIDEDNVVLAGNATIEAAAQAGIDRVRIVDADGDEIIAVRRSGLSANQKTRLALFDNRAAELAEWEPGVLIALEKSGTAMSGLWYDAEWAEEIAGPETITEGLTDPDAVPDPPKVPTTKVGDVWQLGNHRIMCGDSTVVTDVEKLMNGERAVLMATDPPYLVDYQGGNHPESWSNKAEVKDKHWDDYSEGAGVQFYVDFITTAIAVALIPNPAIYQWHASMRTDVVMTAWRTAGLLPHQVIIWVKARPVLTHSHYMWQHEPCMYGWIQGSQPISRPPANEKTVWEINQQGESDGIHPTQKPVEVVKRPIEYHTDPRDLIYEPFSGSGTAIVAAEQTGRRCYAMELSPEFVDVAVQRWQDFTGQTAELATA